MYKKLSIAAFCLMAALQANAQNDNNQWSLEECISYAKDKNIQVQMSQLNVRESHETIQNAKEQRLPSVNASVGENFSRGLSFDVFTNQPVTDNVWTTNFNLNAGVTLFNGFRIKNNISKSQTDAEANLLDMQKTENDISLQVAAAYLQILFAEENVSVAQKRVASNNDQIERMQKMVEAGALPLANLLDMQAQKTTNESQLITAENQLTMAKLQIKQLLRLEADSPFNIVRPEIGAPESLVFASLGTVYNSAESHMPEVKSADLRAESASMSEEIAKGAYLPSLTANAGVTSNYSTNNLVYKETETGQKIPTTEIVSLGTQLDESLRYYAGLTLRIPIYNNRSAKNQVEISRINIERAQLNAQSVRQQLRSDIERAYTEALAAQKTFIASSKQVEALTEQFRTIENRYNNGAANATDYTVAQNNLNIAQAELIRAKYDYVFKSKVLDFYQGRPIILN
ncbi:TolC family protein [Limibacter armeniacum]|uniref:TolC family protein n=1 Tax=Limibacter armeniacum TaxID=466084 RepID=UPI002FE59007